MKRKYLVGTWARENDSVVGTWERGTWEREIGRPYFRGFFWDKNVWHHIYVLVTLA